MQEDKGFTAEAQRTQRGLLFQWRGIEKYSALPVILKSSRGENTDSIA